MANLSPKKIIIGLIALVVVAGAVVLGTQWGGMGSLFQGYISVSPIAVPIIPRCVTAPSGMVNWWDGDKISSTTAVDLKNNANALLQNGATTATGKVGKAFNLDGTNDRLLIHMPNVYSAMTMDAWVKHDGFTLYHEPVIFAQDGGIYWRLRLMPAQIGTQNNLVFEYDNGSTRKSFLAGCTPGVGSGCDNWPSGIPSIQAGQWYHVAAAFNVSTGSVNVYVNGVKVPITATTTSTSTPRGFLTDLLVGSSYDADATKPGPDPWNGLIDEVEVYNKMLSQTEIQTIYKAGAGGKCKP